MSCPLSEVAIPRILEVSPQVSKYGYPLRMTITISRYKLILALNDFLVHSDFTNKVIGDRGATQSKLKLMNCFYQGWVEPFVCQYRVFDNWNVTVSACHGLRGEFGNFPYGYVIVKPNGLSFSIHQNHTLSFMQYGSGLYARRSKIIAAKSAKLRQSPDRTVRPVIELMVYSDDSMYSKHKKSRIGMIHYIANAVNKVDMLYDALGIDIALNGLVTWKKINTKLNNSNIVSVLKEFNAILYKQGRHRFDVGVLFSGRKYTPIGLAYRGTCCSIVNGLVVGQDYESIDLAAIYLAHEIAHTLGVSHDDDEDPGNVGCHCDSRQCIMSSIIQENDPPKQWSNCSVKNFRERLSERRYDCLYNRYGKTVTNFNSQILLHAAITSQIMVIVN